MASYNTWMDRRAQWVKAHNSLVWPGWGGGDPAPPDSEFAKATWAYQAEVDRLIQEYEKTLTPQQLQEYQSAIQSNSNKLDSINKIGKTAAMGVIGAAGLGAAATGAGLLGGAPAGGTGAGAGAMDAAGSIGGSGTIGTGASGSGLYGLTSPSVLPAAASAAGGGSLFSQLGAAASGMPWGQIAGLASSVVGGVGSAIAAKGAKDAADNATDAQVRIADAQAQLGRDQLAFTKEQWAQMKPTMDAMSQRAIQISDAQLAQMKQQSDIAADYDNYNKTTFRPLEQGIVADAQGYDTPARRAEAAARASADVEKTAGMAVADMNRDILRRGGTLDDGGARGNTLDLALGKARMRAGASDSAVRNIEQQGYARKMDAASLGRGLPANQATSAAIANTAGNGSNANMQTALNPQMQGVQQVQSGYNSAAATNANSGNLYGQASRTYADMMDSYNRIAGAAGVAAGNLAMMKWGT